MLLDTSSMRPGDVLVVVEFGASPLAEPENDAGEDDGVISTPEEIILLAVVVSLAPPSVDMI